MDLINDKRVKFSPEEREKIRVKCGYKCNVCKSKLRNFFHVDHIKPLANLGTNDMDNLQSLCVPCHIEKCKNEHLTCQYILPEVYESTYNSQTFELINGEFFKTYAFIEEIDFSSSKFMNKHIKVDMDKYEKVSIDCNKTRKNLLYYSKYDFPKYNTMDDITKFKSLRDKNGKYKIGFFYVETSNYFPLRGNGYYCSELVIYCIHENIIKEENIKFEWISSKPLDKGYFKKFMDYTVQKLGDNAKLINNSLIGSFNIKSFTSSKSFFVQSLKDVSNMVLNKGYKAFELADNLFRVTNDDKEFINVSNASPIYIQIVQLEAMELHKLKKIIERKEGTPYQLNTDSIGAYVLKSNPIKISKYFWDKEKTVPKYKFEDVTKTSKDLKMEAMKGYKRQENCVVNMLSWNKKNISGKKDPGYKMLVKKIYESQQSACIQGCAGSGKSEVIKSFIELLKTLQLNYYICAPTNKACEKFEDGKTLDKMFKKLVNSKDLSKSLKSIHYIIVDEISMMHSTFYKVLNNLQKSNKNIKFLLCGDFNQFEPVCDDAKYDYPESTCLKELSNCQLYRLTDCMRSDSELFNLCTTLLNTSEIETSTFDNHTTPYNIVFTNKKRIQINAQINEEYGTKFMKQKLGSFVIFECPKNDVEQQRMIITSRRKSYRDCYVIGRKNCKKYGVINSKMYVVLKVNNKEKSITVVDKCNDKNETVIPFSEFQSMFLLGYAITAHKSQGDTLNHPYSIHEFNKMDTRGKYVSLSRATSKKLINIV
jgi:hypothetical protein